MGGAHLIPSCAVRNPSHLLEYIMTFCLINGKWIGARDITDIYIARAYLRMRMQDAVFCYRRQHFDNPIELARYLARYW